MGSELERRIAALESRIGSNDVAVLGLPDGTMRTISATAKHFHELAQQAEFQRHADGQTIACTPLWQELEWIKQAVTIDEPAHLIELLAVFLHGPVPRGQLNNEEKN